MNKRKITGTIKSIENVEGIKTAGFEDYIRLHLESGNPIDVTPNYVEDYQKGDKIEYLVDKKGNLIYKEQGIPEYLQNKSLIERNN